MNWRERLDKLAPDTSVRGCEIYYEYRDQRVGAGNGVRGISGNLLIEAYRQGLASAYDALSRTRNHSPRSPIKVYVFHIPEAVTSTRRDMKYGWPFSWSNPEDPHIGLPSRTKDTYTEAAADRARVEAVHEMAHQFNLASRHLATCRNPETRLDLGPVAVNQWDALDEATAVFMERVVFPSSRSTLYYASDWIDHPERPLLSTQGAGPTWVFLDYLSQKHPDIVSDLWNNEGPTKSVTDMLTALTLYNSFDELFGTYAAESYFTGVFCPDLHALHKPCRASRYTDFLRKDEKPDPRKGTLEHLACHYYRYKANGGVGKIKIALRRPPGSRLKLYVAGRLRDLRPCGIQEISAPTDGSAVEVNTAAISACDYFIATVANCVTASTQARPGAVDYELSVQAV